MYCPNLETGGSRGVGRARRAPREKVPPQLPAGWRVGEADFAFRPRPPSYPSAGLLAPVAALKLEILPCTLVQGS